MCREQTIEQKVMFDMAIPRVKVVNPNESWLGTECFIDGNKVNNVRSIDFRVAVDEVPQFTFETLGLPEIDMPGTVQFSFTPETVQQAAVVLQNEFKRNAESMGALIESIESAINDAPEETWKHDLAVLIAHRIVGLEEK